MKETMGKYGYTQYDSNDYVRRQGEYVIKARVLDFTTSGFNPRIYIQLIHCKNGKIDETCVNVSERMTASNKPKLLADVLNRINTYVNSFI